MKTKKIFVNNQELGMEDALTMTEGLGMEQELEVKQLRRLRLLAEELFGMLRSIAGVVEADYWVEYEAKSFEIHLKSDVSLTEEMRKQFLAASSSGENAAAKGFMGRLKVMIAETLFANAASDSMMFSGLSMGLMSMASPTAMGAGSTSYLWSMQKCKDEAGKNGESEVWDELEKSIVANIADEVKVKIVGTNVEIIVCKAFE